MDDFLEFLRTGKVRGLGVGSTQDEVRAVLGPPEDTSVSHRPRIWKYGATEITFDGTEVMMIALSVDAESAVVRERLEAEGLPYEVDAELTYERQEAFVVSTSGVTLTLSRELPLARGFATARGD